MHAQRGHGVIVMVTIITMEGQGHTVDIVVTVIGTVDIGYMGAGAREMVTETQTGKQIVMTGL